MRKSLMALYETRKVDLPTAGAVAGRLIEEMVELCLACNTSSAEILLHVADALANEARKAGCFPSELSIERPLSFDDIETEIADVGLWLKLLQDLAAIKDSDIQKKEDIKLDVLFNERLYVSPSNLFYRQKGHEVDNKRDSHS